jgi:hypothetical protein
MLFVLGFMAVFYQMPKLYTVPLNRELLVWPAGGILLWAYWQGAQLVGAETPKASEIPIGWILMLGFALAVMATWVPAGSSYTIT